MSSTHQRQGSKYIRKDTGTLVVRAQHTVTRESARTTDPLTIHTAKQMANKQAIAQVSKDICHMCGAQEAITEWDKVEVCEECYFYMHDRFEGKNEVGVFQ